MRAPDRIDLIARDYVAPVLKQVGFRKTGRTWRRAVGSAIQVINLQASRWNEAESGEFTCNVGVYFPEAAQLAESVTAGRERPSESDCIVRERLGRLMPIRCDYWWPVDAQSDHSSTGGEVAAAVLEFGLPWVDAHTDPVQAMTWAVTNNFFFWAAVFALACGDPGLAAKHIRRAISEASGAQPLRDSLQEWAERRGLVNGPS